MKKYKFLSAIVMFIIVLNIVLFANITNVQADEAVINVITKTPVASSNVMPIVSSTPTATATVKPTTNSNGMNIITPAPKSTNQVVVTPTPVAKATTDSTKTLQDKLPQTGVNREVIIICIIASIFIAIKAKLVTKEIIIVKKKK